MSKEYIVNKCGGGIMVPTLLPLVKKALAHQMRLGYAPIVVVSAVKDVTDTLIGFLVKTKQDPTAQNITNFIAQLRDTHEQLFGTLGESFDAVLKNLTKDIEAYARQSDSIELEAKIISYGEKLSALCAAEYLSEAGTPATPVFAENIPLLTDAVIKDANILYDQSEKNLQKYLSKINSIPVIAGFTGVSPAGAVTLLGRGGTDTTACFVGAAMRARRVVLWKDVGAVYSADPKLVKEARTIPFLSYDEVEEAGKIIQGKAVRYLRQYKIEAEVASLKNFKDKTTIRELKKAIPGARLVSFKKSLTLFSLSQGDARGYERLSEVSDLCARYKVNVVLIWNDPTNLHVVVEDTSGLLPELTAEVAARFPHIESTTVHMITIVGDFNWKDVNIFNQTLHKLDAKALMGACPYPKCLRMEGIVVAKNDVASLLRAMHKVFIFKK
ncbi:MAG: hypothetical protein WCT40_02255 [Candidatus Magasanikbacteria bacterium]